MVELQLEITSFFFFPVNSIFYFMLYNETISAIIFCPVENTQIGSRKAVQPVFPSAATVTGCIIPFMRNAEYFAVSDRISNVLVGAELLMLAASAGGESVYTTILKAWGIRSAGYTQYTNMAEMQKKGLVRASIDAISECVPEDGRDRKKHVSFEDLCQSGCIH